MPERRTEVRMMCADIVDVQWKDTAGKRRHCVGLLEDISSSGACLQLESPLPLGAEVTLKCPQREFEGHIRYCVYREIGYFAGIQFERSCRWSKRTFKPQHMLDPRTLTSA
jgi:PilZ domain